jgi:hypothetical protein
VPPPTQMPAQGFILVKPCIKRCTGVRLVLQGYNAGGPDEHGRGMLDERVIKNMCLQRALDYVPLGRATPEL